MVGIKFCGISDGVDDCAASRADNGANSEIIGSLLLKKGKKKKHPSQLIKLIRRRTYEKEIVPGHTSAEVFLNDVGLAVL